MSDDVRSDIQTLLNLRSSSIASEARIESETRLDDHIRKLVSHRAQDGELIEACLFEPIDSTPRSGVIVLHQHNSE